MQKPKVHWELLANKNPLDLCTNRPYKSFFKKITILKKISAFVEIGL
jgi:hypothetical protein